MTDTPAASDHPTDPTQEKPPAPDFAAVRARLQRRKSRPKPNPEAEPEVPGRDAENEDDLEYAAPHLELDGEPIETLDQFDELIARGVVPTQHTYGFDPRADNIQRAREVYRVLHAYAGRRGQLNWDAKTVMGDFTSDLRHLCDAFGLSWEDATPYYHYDSDIQGG